ncbi:MAG: cytochrome c oxidase assembly protein [Actinomycetota bacterium]
MPDATIGWHPHVEVWALVIFLGTGYRVAVKRWGPQHVSPGEPPATRGQVVSFFLGLFTILVVSSWPIHELAEERLLSVHMTQHLLLSLVAPPLLLFGTPGWLMRRLLRPRLLAAVVRNLSRPFIALLLFNAFIAFSHWPVIVGAAVDSELTHFTLHFALFGTAMLMWMPVLSPMFEIPRLRYPAQMMYLFAQSIVPTVPASFLTFADGPIYPFYGLASPLIGVDPVTDQRIAGLIMKIVGGFILWGFIAVLFFKWHKQDELTGSEEPVWQDVEREANRMEVG